MNMTIKKVLHSRLMFSVSYFLPIGKIINLKTFLWLRGIYSFQ